MEKKLQKIFAYLKELFPSPETELHYSTPFQFVVAVMLSAQATDVQVNKVTLALFKKIKNPEDLVNMGLEAFEQSIRSVNYYKTKAKHIFETSQIIAKSRQKSSKMVKSSLKPDAGSLMLKTMEQGIPSTVEELMKLPGIGVKTAKLIAHVLYDQPFIAVDTHIHRVSNRLGLVKTTAPEKTSELLEKIIPNDYKDLAHHALVLFGRYYCTARAPKCVDCKLKSMCEWYKTNV